MQSTWNSVWTQYNLNLMKKNQIQRPNLSTSHPLCLLLCQAMKDNTKVSPQALPCSWGHKTTTPETIKGFHKKMAEGPRQ